MLPNQKAVVDRNILELTEAVKHETPVLLNYFETNRVICFEERELVESNITSAGKITNLFNIIKEKDSGWFHLLTYMNGCNKSSLADKLQRDADGETVENPSKRIKRSALELFAQRLADYYRVNYAYLPTMGESPKHVEDVWVPLQIDGRDEDFLEADKIDHVELLNRLKLHRGRYNMRPTRRRNIAVVKGDPGMGKTTLCKKIAYDWALSYGSTTKQQFSLVLAVPLRSAGMSNRFDELAIDYFLSILDHEEVGKSDLIREIRQLESELLVILDGLDEYRSYSESLFKDMFAAPFKHSSSNATAPPPAVTFKLIITSRPYACERINDEFFPLRFVIMPLDADHLVNFVQLYCQTPHGIAKVTEYLKANAELVIQVPLILTFVCFLADSVQEIPTNTTSLYESLIKQMIRREIRQGKLADSVELQSWKESNLGKATGKLAYQGCTGFGFNVIEHNSKFDRMFSQIKGMSNYYEFTQRSLSDCNVTNDSFVCGFLLYKYDFAQATLMAEFPHRSLQEFFAALHCYQLMLAGSMDELKEIYAMISPRGGQVGRFLFGICSKERRLDQMATWLVPSIFPIELGNIDLAAMINRFGTSLLDCSTEENCTFGHMLFAGDLEGSISSFWDKPVDLRGKLGSISDAFKDSLHLRVLNTNSEGEPTDWFLADNIESARLAVTYGGTPALMQTKMKFAQMDILLWQYDDDTVDAKQFVRQLTSLPPVKTLVTVTILDRKSVSVSIRYACKDVSKLTYFRFGCDDDAMNDMLETVQAAKFVTLKVQKRNRRADSGDNFWHLEVTVKDDISQPTLIISLIRLSLLEMRKRM